MEDDKIIYYWNDFAENAPNTFRELWTDQNFANVTLATEDGHQIRAHKVILSSCSQFFRILLIKNPHQNPLIYLKGINHAELEMVLKFIYLGECHVSYEELHQFLATGMDLQVIGLMETADNKYIRNQDDFKIDHNFTPPQPLDKTEEKESFPSDPDITHNTVPTNVHNQQQISKSQSTGIINCKKCENRTWVFASQ